MELSVLSYFLPDLILEHFELSSFQRLCDIKTKKGIFEIHLDEKNIINIDDPLIFMSLKVFYQEVECNIFQFEAKPFI